MFILARTQWSIHCRIMSFLLFVVYCLNLFADVTLSFFTPSFSSSKPSPTGTTSSSIYPISRLKEEISLSNLHQSIYDSNIPKHPKSTTYKSSRWPLTNDYHTSTIEKTILLEHDHVDIKFINRKDVEKYSRKV